MRRTELAVLILLTVLMPVLAQTAYMSVPTDGSTSSDELQSVVFTFITPSMVDPSTIVLNVDGTPYTVADPELTWAPSNLYFNSTVPYGHEGEVIVSLTDALDWFGEPLAGLPINGLFYLDMSGPYVLSSGLVGYAGDLPTIVTVNDQAGEWFVYDDYSDMDPFSIQVEVEGETYTYPSAGLIWVNDSLLVRADTIIIGEDTTITEYYADYVGFDPVAADVYWNPMDTVSMELLQVNDTPDYGTYNELIAGELNSFFFFVDYIGPTAEMISPIAWRTDGIHRMSCDTPFVFQVTDANGVDLTSVQIMARGTILGYSATYFDVDTIVIDTVFHFFVTDTIFKLWVVYSDYDWESRCGILDTYTESGLTCWAVRIYTPLQLSGIYATQTYTGREAAKAAAFDYALLGFDPLIQKIVPDFNEHMTFIETYNCTEGENVYIVDPDDPIPGTYLYDTLVTGRQHLNAVANMYYPGMGWGLEPVFGRIAHPFFAAVYNLIPKTVQFTYTPVPQLYEGEDFHLELVGCNDIYGNPLLDTLFRVRAVDSTFNWEARCEILETYFEDPYTCWAVDIELPIPPGYVDFTVDCYNRADAIDFAFDFAALDYDALIEPVNVADVKWHVFADRSAPYLVEYYPPHNTITTNTAEQIWVRLGDTYGAVDPFTVRMHIESTSGYSIDIDGMPLPPWPAEFVWDYETGTFLWDPTTAGVTWSQGDTITVFFLDVGDSIEFCEANYYADEYDFASWVFYIVDGPYLTSYYPTSGSFTACQGQDIGFILYDLDGIDETTVLFEVEGRIYDITSEDTNIICYYVPTGPGDSILVGCDTIIYNPLLYYGAGSFIFTPPSDFAVNARQIDCAIRAAQDVLGNPMWYSGDFAWYYIYDFTGPVFYNPQPAPGTYAPGEDLLISIALFDSVCGAINLAGLQWRLGGTYFGPITHPEFCWFDGEYFWLDLAEAGMTFPDETELEICLFSVYDAPEYYCAAYTNPALGTPYCWTFNIDNSPPGFQLLEPLDGATTACPEQQIDIMLTDNLGVDPTSPVVIIEGVIYTTTSPYLTISGDTLLTFTPPVPWVNGQVVDFSLAEVADIAGNVITGSPLISSFTVDLLEPTVVYTVPAFGEIIGEPIDEILIVLDDISGINEETAEMMLEVDDGITLDIYNFVYDDGVFTFGTEGVYYTVALDIALAGVVLPPRGAEITVAFTIQDAPDFECFGDPEITGNILDLTNYIFDITPGWEMELVLVPTVITYDTTDSSEVPASGETFYLTMGAAFGATDDYDPGVDVVAPPYPPDADTFPMPVVPPSFLLGSTRLIVDLKALASIDPTWILWTGTTAGTLWWDTTAIPDYGSFVINGYIDMRSTTYFVYGPYEAIYINFSPDVITLYSGWNLVSVPVTPIDASPEAVFGVPAYQVFWYNPWSLGYEVPAAIYPGYAYFVLYIPGDGEPDEISFTVTGVPVYEYTLTVPGGWNTLGSVYDFGGVPVSTASISVGGSIWGDALYGYDGATGSYTSSSEFIPGEGYWAYIELPIPYYSCDVTVRASWMKTSPYTDPLVSDDVAHLNIGDEEFILAVQEDASMSPDPELDRLLPPAMMDNAHSAYFACGSMQLSRDVRPIDQWTLVVMKNTSIETDRELVIDGVNYDGTFNLAAGTYKVSFGAIAKLPKAFALYQNNPNPFNPITEIKFDMPTRDEVRLEVFNMLGQKVRTLISGDIDAGQHSVRWDGIEDSGRDAASGVYFYKLNTADRSFTRKMVLLR